MHGNGPQGRRRTSGTDPFVTRLKHFVDLTPGDSTRCARLIESEMTVEKRRDLVVDGYEYRKLCFIKEGFAARYKLLRNGKRQIVNVLCRATSSACPAASSTARPFRSSRSPT